MPKTTIELDESDIRTALRVYAEAKGWKPSKVQVLCELNPEGSGPAVATVYKAKAVITSESAD
ncbi:MAG: hypothetical protein AAGE80_05630 [Pseudomonadota bacterium]